MIHCCHLPAYKGPARYDYTFSPEDLAISDGRFPFCRAISSYPFCGWDFPWNKPSNFLCIPHGCWKIQKKHIGIDDLPSYTSIDRWLSSPVGLPDPESPQIWGFLILFPKYKWPETIVNGIWPFSGYLMKFRPTVFRGSTRMWSPSWRCPESARSVEILRLST